MKLNKYIYDKTLETLDLYWVLVKLTLPVAVATQFLIEIGAVTAMAPALSPVMDLFGLPPELAIAWVTGLLVGIWGAVVVLFTLVPIAEFSVADMTVFSALMLFAHALPIEQRIIQKVGPKLISTTLIRLIGGMIYAAILHQIFETTSSFTQPIQPAWIPKSDGTGWENFFYGTAETMFWMLIILFFLAWTLELLKRSGIMNYINNFIAPLFKLAGIRGEANSLVAVGLLLGVSYGGGLLIQEAKTGNIPSRQIFLSCIFMGFAHSIIEDTIIVIALGADFTSVFIGRIIFAIIATAFIAWVLKLISDNRFYMILFKA